MAKSNARFLRAAKLARWILLNADIINEPQQMRLVFDCKGGNVAVEISNKMFIHTSELDLNSRTNRQMT